MKTLFVKLVTGNSARIRVWITSAAAMGLAWVVMKLNLQLDAVTQAAIAAAIGGWVLGLIESPAAKMSQEGIKKVQAILPEPLKEDGHAGPATIGVLKQVVQQAGEPTPPLTKEEKTAVLKTANPTAPTNQ